MNSMNRMNRTSLRLSPISLALAALLGAATTGASAQTVAQNASVPVGSVSEPATQDKL